MEVVKVRLEGILWLAEYPFPVFSLDSGRKAVTVASVCHFLTGRNAKKGIRYTLSNTKFKRYLPEKTFFATEVCTVVNGAEIYLFYAEEWVQLCNAIVLAGLNDHLSQTWKLAYPKAQLLLTKFALPGIDKLISQAISKHPVLPAKDFENLLKKIVGYKTF